jgi:hypothetical protein
MASPFCRGIANTEKIRREYRIRSSQMLQRTHALLAAAKQRSALKKSPKKS